MNQSDVPNKLKPALVGGLVFGIASGLPIIGWLNCACCGLVAAGGFLAAYLYQKDSPRIIEYGDGAAVGLLTGLIGAVIDTLVSLPFSLLSFATFDFDEAEVLEDLNLPPNLQELAEAMVAQEAMVGSTFVITLFINIIIWLIFATIGAIIGVAVFQKRDAALQGPPPPQAPPPAGPPPPIE